MFIRFMKTKSFLHAEDIDKAVNELFGRHRMSGETFVNIPYLLTKSDVKLSASFLNHFGTVRDQRAV